MVTAEKPRTSPISRTPATDFIRKVTFPLWTLRDHPHYRRYRERFERTQFLGRGEIRAQQLAELNRLLQHAWRTVPFYRDRIKEAGLHCGLDSLDELKRLQPTTKRDIQNAGSAMWSAGFPEAKRTRNQTGGSTGSPLQFYVDNERFDSRMASTWRHNRWARFEPGDWCAQLWGARLDQIGSESLWDSCRNHFLYRVLQLNTSSVSDEDFTAYVEKLRRFKPRVMVTYANSAVAFCRYLQQNGITDIRFDSIITTAEVLLPEHRQLIEEVTGGSVFNRYGCREVSVIASECEYYTGMHVNAETLYVEIEPAGNDLNGPGRILVTDLLNRSMPLIRYEIGDVGRWAADQSCPCGRGLPLLAEVNGRTTDFLILKDGRRVSGPALTLVVADMADVAQVQFHQKSTEQVTLKVVPGKSFGPHTIAELKRRLDLYLRGAAELTIEPVESIPSELSGKYRFVISTIGESV
jgi:phenylacetate-CoA ligase